MLRAPQDDGPEQLVVSDTHTGYSEPAAASVPICDVKTANDHCLDNNLRHIPHAYLLGQLCHDRFRRLEGGGGRRAASFTPGSFVKIKSNKIIESAITPQFILPSALPVLPLALSYI